jgi:hypothetical protein
LRGSKEIRGVAIGVSYKVTEFART